MKTVLNILLAGVLPASAWAQVMVSGTVTDQQTGEPMAFVTVAVEGSFVGTTTDNDGSYAFEIGSFDDLVVFSFVGYKTQKHRFSSDNTTFDVQLEPTMLHYGLHDVVVVGTRRLPRLVTCLLYTSPSPRDRTRSRMPSSA